MKAAHTPGPWYVGVLGTCVLAGDPKQSYNHVVSAPFTDGRDGPVLPESEQRANARLIAAAPELLAALEKAVEQYGKPGGPWNVSSTPGTWIADAQAAIAKAVSDA